MAQCLLPLGIESPAPCPLCGSDAPAIARINKRVRYRCAECGQEFELIGSKTIASTGSNLLEVQGHQRKEPSGRQTPDGSSDLAHEWVARSGVEAGNDPSTPRTVNDDCARKVQ